MERTKSRIPKHCRHKRSGRGYVTLSGTQIPTGKHGSPEADAKYDSLVREWLENGRRPLGRIADSGTFLIEHVAAEYWEFAEEKYSLNGSPKGELKNVRHALKHFLASHLSDPVEEFGPLRLKEFQLSLARKNLSRGVVNKVVSHVKRMFKWAVSEELLSAERYHAVLCVPSLARGDGRVRESDPVQAVSEADMRAVLPHLSPTIEAMVLLQWYTGMRPGEVRGMRSGEIRWSDGDLCYEPTSHKNSHRGKIRRIWLGPSAQRVLKPFLSECIGPEAPVFSPAAAMEQRRIKRREARKSRVTPSQRKREAQARRGPKRKFNETYTSGAYGLAIARACRKAGVPVWSPNQLRHAAATRIRSEYGAEAAQHCLGHASLRTTEIYAERSDQAAKQAMREIG